MALPPTPPGYSNWNSYIELNAPALASAQGLTLQEAKASLKLLDVCEAYRQDPANPNYMVYNVFTTWSQRTVSPTTGRPWRQGGFSPIAPGTFIVTENGLNTLTTEAASGSNNIVSE